MPTYEYTCRACGHTFDIVQKMSDDTLTVCPECGGALRKVFAPPAIAFKGSGFYATDHGTKAKPPDDAKRDGDTKDGASKTTSTSDEGGSREKTGSSGDAKGDAKSDAKRDEKPSSAAANEGSS